MLAVFGLVGLVLFGQAYLWGAQVALDRHDDMWIAIGLASLAVLNAVVLGWAIYRSPLVRVGTIGPLCGIVVGAWPVNIVLVLVIYGWPLV